MRADGRSSEGRLPLPLRGGGPVPDLLPGHSSAPHDPHVRPRRHRRRHQRHRHRARRRGPRAVGAAAGARRPGRGDVVGLDQADPWRAALPGVLRLPPGARIAGRARGAVARRAAYRRADAVRAAAPSGAAAALDDPRRAVPVRPHGRTEDPAADAHAGPAHAIRPARRCARHSPPASSIPTAGWTTRGWWC